MRGCVVQNGFGAQQLLCQNNFAIKMFYFRNFASSFFIHNVLVEVYYTQRVKIRSKPTEKTQHGNG